MKKYLMPFFVLSGIVCLIGLYQQQNQLTIGVINLNDCLDKYEKFRELKKQFEEKKKVSAEELDNIVKKIEEVRQKADSAPEHSPPQLDKLEEYETLMASAKIKRTRINQELEMDRIKYKEAIYSEIASAAEAIAKEKGIQLLLKGELPWEEEAKGAPGKAFELKVLYRIVMSYDKSLDITDSVVKKLNDEYAKKKAQTSSKNN